MKAFVPRGLMALLLLATVVAAEPAAAKSERLYFYYQCATRSYCFSSSINVRHTSMEYFSMHAACRGGQSIDILNVPRSVRISSRTRRFAFTKPVTTFEDGAVVLGTVTVTGRVYRKKRLVGAWSVDNVATDCQNRTAGTFRMRFKFITGGDPLAASGPVP